MATKKTTTKTTTTKSTKKAPAKTTGKTTAKTTKAKATTKAPAKQVAQSPAKKASAKSDKKLTALDAAAKVLTEAGEPLNAKQMIERMAAKKYWTSPGGKTPHSTLYAAITREINAKAKDARFQKTDRGLFAINK